MDVNAAVTMRAAVHHGRRDIRIEQVPTPVRAGREVLIRVLRFAHLAELAGS